MTPTMIQGIAAGAISALFPDRFHRLVKDLHTPSFLSWNAPLAGLDYINILHCHNGSLTHGGHIAPRGVTAPCVMSTPYKYS